MWPGSEGGQSENSPLIAASEFVSQLLPPEMAGAKRLLKPLRETAEAISRELGFSVREG